MAKHWTLFFDTGSKIMVPPITLLLNTVLDSLPRTLKQEKEIKKHNSCKKRIKCFHYLKVYCMHKTSKRTQINYKNLWKLNRIAGYAINRFKSHLFWGHWVAQAVVYSAPDCSSCLISWFVGLRLGWGSVLTAQSQLRILSLHQSLPSLTPNNK